MAVQIGMHARFEDVQNPQVSHTIQALPEGQSASLLQLVPVTGMASVVQTAPPVALVKQRQPLPTAVLGQCRPLKFGLHVSPDVHPHSPATQVEPLRTVPAGQTQVCPEHTPFVGQVTQAPLQQVCPAEQQVFPQGVPAPVQATELLAPLHVEFALLAHETPALQHAFPQGVVPAGQPQVLEAASTQATPALQQHWLQGVVPATQGMWLAVVAPEQTTWSPAYPRNGLSTVATADAPTAPAITLRTFRLLVGSAIARDRPSNRSLTASPSWSPQDDYRGSSVCPLQSCRAISFAVS